VRRMPSAKVSNEWDEDDSNDPDYRESSDSDNESDIPRSMARDRARWIEDNVDEIAALYRALKNGGETVFGGAFLQAATINNFANFCYKYTAPGGV